MMEMVMRIACLWCLLNLVGDLGPGDSGTRSMQIIIIKKKHVKVHHFLLLYSFYDIVIGVNPSHFIPPEVCPN